MPGKHLAPRAAPESGKGRHRQSHRRHAPPPVWCRPSLLGGVGAAALLASGSVYVAGLGVDAMAADSGGDQTKSATPPEVPDLEGGAAYVPELLQRERNTAPQVSRSGGRDTDVVVDLDDLGPMTGCAPVEGEVTDAQNGLIEVATLCELPQPGELLRTDAAAAWWELSIAYKRDFGSYPCVTDSYRNLDEQYAVAAAKPGLAAAPGKSNHGLAVALDLCGGIQSGAGSPAFDWMQDNAPAFGWENPEWAQTSLYEPWHWEYAAAVSDSGEDVD